MKLLFVFTLLLIIYSTNAQNLEIGLGLGASNTRSDISNINYLNTRPGAWVFGRWNFNSAWVARLDYKYMFIYASDKNNNYPLANFRKDQGYTLEFSNQLHELSANMEYNFLDYRSANKKVRLTPYITGGLGFLRLINEYEYGSGTGRYDFVIPFGLGLKYVLTKTLNLGMVFSSTKTFSDALDNVNGSYPRLLRNSHAKGWDQATNDWYYFLGFSISYTYYHIACPDFYDF
ncbi:MAG: DUF6089 family protein [Bacteroidota bacterium]|nr:DUF6089 family protein [Bacteroidota bacterium]